MLYICSYRNNRGGGRGRGFRGGRGRGGFNRGYGAPYGNDGPQDVSNMPLKGNICVSTHTMFLEINVRVKKDHVVC